MDDNNSNNNNQNLEPCYEEKAGFCSKRFFSWLGPLIKLASTKILKLADLPDIVDSDKSNIQIEKFQKEWKRQIKENINKKNTTVTLISVLKKVYGPSFMSAGFVKLGHDILQYTAPILLSLILQFIENGSTDTFVIFNINIPTGIIFAILLFLNQVIQNFFLNAYFHRCYRIGMQTRACVISAIYNKSLHVSMSDQLDASTGSIVNLMSNDTNRIMRICSYGHNLWSAPFQIIVAFTLLMLYIGPSCVVGILVMIVSIPTKKYFARQIVNLREKVVKMTEQRVKLINDVLQGIRIIKLYAWEESFLKLISNVRQKEMDCLNKEIIVKSINETLWNLTPILVAMSTFAVYAYSGREMKASVIFTALALFTRIRFPLSVFPSMITSLIDFFVASDRITAFLHQQEVEGLKIYEKIDEAASITVEGDAIFMWNHHYNNSKKKSEKNIKKEEEEKKTNDGDDGGINTPTANTTKAKENFLLKNINLTLKSGQLCMVCGKVGSGKSSLVQAILGEMKCKSGNVKIRGNLSYVPQSAWILNDTVRKNVILENEFDEAKYKMALDCSELISDLNILPAGDKTEIGEKGINISGGQKQRVALARAIYHDRDIVILDDVLSALDVHVGKKVFNKLILGQLKSKLVILVTHDLSLLQCADHILHIEDGEIVSSGSYDFLMKNNNQFQDLLVDIEQNRKDDTNVKEEESIVVKTTTADATNIDTNDVLIETKAENTNKSTDEERKAGSKMIKAEVRAKGSVSFKTVFAYFGSFFPRMSSGMTIALILFFMALAKGLTLATSWWLSWWVTSVELSISGYVDHAFFIGIYGLFTFGVLILILISSIFTATGAISAATRLHDNMLSALLSAPMYWFETTPTGRTLSRCSKDVDEADTLLRQAFTSMLNCMVESLSILVLVTILTGGWLIMGLIPVTFLYYHAMIYYRKTSRELKRLESVSRSPIFSHFSETLNGLSSVRTFQIENVFEQKILQRVDTNHRAFFLINAANRWLSIRLELIGGTLTLLTCIILVISSTPTTAALAGLALVYITQMLNTLNWGVRQVSETEVRFNAVERLLEYQGEQFPKEKSSTFKTDPTTKMWPSHGKIEFVSYSMRYRKKLPLVLKNISCTIPAGSRVGICGRTGSGKSSMFVALFRLVEPADGSIKIDDIDSKTLGLRTLRSRIAVIPQDPVLFVGTIRNNLDPFEQYEDSEIWDALKLCNMYEACSTRPSKLESAVSESGQNFSQGERQLLCIARALLRKPKILLLDEATASIDFKTDKLVQDMIRKNFIGCTTLTIAHRLNTIADSDLIMVLDDGKIAELDTPEKLMQLKDGIYRDMVDADEVKESNI